MTKFNANDTEIRNISRSKKLVREFLENNHVQGYPDNSSIIYGLFLDKLLVQVMAFGRPKNDYIDFQYELLRDCVLESTDIVDGSSKLFSKFLEDHQNAKSICVYTILDKENNSTDRYTKNLGFTTSDKANENNNFIQKDFWYAGGYTYKIVHVPSGKFYVGMSERVNEYSRKHYMGSGRIIKNFQNKYPEEEFTKEIVEEFTHPSLLRDAEVALIAKYKDDENCLNVKTARQGSTACPECRLAWSHLESCSRYVSTVCDECGGTNYRHMKRCSKANHCPECGNITTHKHSCSHYTQPVVCDECGALKNIHKAFCSKRKYSTVCDECGAIRGQHFKTCYHYTQPVVCDECGALKNCHKAFCSKRKYSTCSECGAKQGSHFTHCSKDTSTCSECGVGRNNHRVGCSKYKPLKPCLECGNRRRHKSTCSKYNPPKKTKPCLECGKKRHAKTCSKSIHNR